MSTLENLGKVITTDVLIIGGGNGGLVAALKAKEENVDVLIVDKATIGYAGQAPRAGNGIAAVEPMEEKVDAFVEYLSRTIGDYLNDQALTKKVAEMSWPAVEQLAEWGVDGYKDENGKLRGVYMGNPWLHCGADLEMCLKLRKLATKQGVKFQNKTQISDLLTDGKKIIGAVGFNLEMGEFYIFRAKAIISSTAGCGYGLARMFNGCGDGATLAWRAGGEMRNCEFGNFQDIVNPETAETHYLPTPFIKNALGESIHEKYVKWNAPDITVKLVMGIEKEVREGRGPIWVDAIPALKSLSPSDDAPPSLDWLFLPKKLEYNAILHGRSAEMGVHFDPKPPVTMWTHANAGYIKVDHDMKSTLEGLWAVGSDIHNGAAWLGATTAPGFRGQGLMNATITGIIGGTAAGKYAAAAELSDVDVAQVTEKKAELFAYMDRADGLDPYAVIADVQDTVRPFRLFIRKDESRIKEALGMLEEVKGKLDKMGASDPHMLGKCLEARSFALHAELYYTASMLRTESRGWHYREDYPERNDDEWAKWIVLYNEDGKIAHRFDPIPDTSYTYKP